MSIGLLIGFSLALFVAVALYNRESDAIIAFTKGVMFGFVYDVEVEDGVKYHTLQAAVGFVILNLHYETAE